MKPLSLSLKEERAPTLHLNDYRGQVGSQLGGHNGNVNIPVSTLLPSNGGKVKFPPAPRCNTHLPDVLEPAYVAGHCQQAPHPYI